MHIRTHEVISYLDERRAELRQMIVAVPPALRDLRRAVNRWSVAEILEHLVLIEGALEQYLSSTWIAQVRAGGLAREHMTDPISPSFDFNRLLDRTIRRKTPPSFQPLGMIGSKAAMRLLEAVRRRLRDTLVSADGLAWGDAMLTYPALDELTMNVYHWALWLGSHEHRHTCQIRDVLEILLIAHRERSG